MVGTHLYHTDHKRSVEKRYLNIAKKDNLLVTGGSDCHGLGKGRVLLGKVKIKYELVDKLKEAAENIKKGNRSNAAVKR